MGCPSGTCTGYELRADLTFDENGDGQMTAAGDPTYWNSGNGWLPIGTGSVAFGATFRATATPSPTYINRATTDSVGLFGIVGGDIADLGVLYANVRGQNRAGVLAGLTASGTIDKAYTTGRVRADGNPGGLVGHAVGNVRASWSTATVIGGSGSLKAGGLLGFIEASSLTASWSAGRLGSSSGGGLVGQAVDGPTITNSYWDTGTSGKSTSAGGVGKSTRDLQRPTAYGSTGSIYANWNIDTDGVTGGDDPWHFGTSRQYPALKFAGRTTPDRGTAWIEADHWNAPVAGEPLVAGLHTKTARALVSPSATITTCDARRDGLHGRGLLELGVVPKEVVDRRGASLLPLREQTATAAGCSSCPTLTHG